MENKQAKTTQVKQNVFDIFIEGARKGLNIGLHNLMPNMLMAYVLAYMLNLLGVMDFIGHWFGPVMGIARTGFGCIAYHVAFLLSWYWRSSIFFPVWNFNNHPSGYFNASTLLDGISSAVYGKIARGG